MKEENKGDIAFSFHKKIIDNEKKRRELFAENASILSMMLEQEHYKAILGDINADWAAYLGQIEVFYSRNEVNNIINIHNKFVKELHILPAEFSDIPRSRLVDIIPFVNNSNYEDWFAKARVLTGRDWNIEVRKEKGLLTEEDEHDHEMQTYNICKKCGAKHKIDETKKES